MTKIYIIIRQHRNGEVPSTSFITSVKNERDQFNTDCPSDREFETLNFEVESINFHSFWIMNHSDMDRDPQ